MEKAVDKAKKRLEQYRSNLPDDPTVPILKAFLDYLPEDGKANFVEDILSLPSDVTIRQHANSLRTCLLIPMKSTSNASSVISSPRDGLDASRENLSTTFVESATREKRMKLECLERDGHRCVVTGDLDGESFDGEDETSLIGSTVCAHIIPFSMAKWKNNRDMDAKLDIWVTLRRCFPVLRKRINFDHTSINETRNGITILEILQGYFGRFEIAFEVTDTVNMYRVVKCVPRRVRVDLPERVTFICHDGRYELPSPELLGIHAAIAKILHASGQGEVTDRILRDRVDTAVLARDGSTNIEALLAATSLSAPSLRQPSRSRDPEEEPKPSPRNISG